MRTWKLITYETFLSPGLMEYCWYRASERKRNRESVKKMKLKSEQKKLMQELRDGTYTPELCRNMQKYDKNANKWRDISCPAFRDQIVHWMVVTMLRGYMENTFIQHNVANIPGRGLSYGNKLLKHWSQQKGTKYVIQMDIKKYYPSINISILMGKLRKKIRDVRFLALIEKILYKESPNGIGLTLGSYLNLWLALFYLNDLDHIMKEQFKVKFYIRYVDDIVILTNKKKEAVKILNFAQDYVKTLGLEIKTAGKGKAKIYKWTDDRFVDMLGTRTYRNKQVLRRNIYLKIRRKIATTRRNITPHNARSLLSYKGMVQHSDCANLHSELVQFIKEEKLKKVASL